MSTINPLGSTGQTGAASDSSSRTQLGQNEFLKLMLTQMQNQDPFKPVDPTEFLGQLAQFSTVTGIQNMEGALGGLADSLRSAQVLNGSTLIGRDVLASTGTARITQGDTLRAGFDTPDVEMQKVEVKVRDSAGQLVRTFNVEPQSGITEFTWDGLTDSGEPAASGEYAIEILASIGGDSYSLEPLVASRVNSVTIDPASQQLVLNTRIGPLALSEVRRVM